MIKGSIRDSNDMLVQKPLSDMGEVLEGIREEFDEHLASINENTNEIQSNYEFICKTDAKLDKLSERIDQIEFFMKKYGFSCEKEPHYSCKPLTKKEQEVFILLYTLEEKGAVTYDNLSRKTGLTTELISVYVTSMIEKGVPLIKRYINNTVFLRIDKEFKKIQTKENILKISQTIIPNIIKNSEN